MHFKVKSTEKLAFEFRDIFFYWNKYSLFISTVTHVPIYLQRRNANEIWSCIEFPSLLKERYAWYFTCLAAERFIKGNNYGCWTCNPLIRSNQLAYEAVNGGKWKGSFASGSMCAKEMGCWRRWVLYVLQGTGAVSWRPGFHRRCVDCLSRYFVPKCDSSKPESVLVTAGTSPLLVELIGVAAYPLASWMREGGRHGNSKKPWVPLNMAIRSPHAATLSQTSERASAPSQCRGVEG